MTQLQNSSPGKQFGSSVWGWDKCTFWIKTTFIGDDGIKTFIQVGDWTHVLIPGKSPVLQASNGSFIFPDTSEGNPQS